MSDNNKDRKKRRSDVTGFSESQTPQRLKNLSRIAHKGDWRRDRKIRIKARTARIMWSLEDDCFTIKTPLPCGMEDFLRKLQTAAGRSFDSLPVPVIDYFKITKENFKSGQFEVEVSFDGKFLIVFVTYLHNFL